VYSLLANDIYLIPSQFPIIIPLFVALGTDQMPHTFGSPANLIFTSGVKKRIPNPNGLDTKKNI